MQIAISQFRGLADLRASVSPILLLAGANGAGKSSACMAISAAASGALLPEGLTKGKAGLLVRDGADLAAIKPAERADVLIRLIGATPTADDLSAALAEQGVPDDLIAEAVKQLPKGWDAAHASYKELGAKIKGRWEQATGTRYGKAKAEGWRPDGWKPVHVDADMAVSYGGRPISLCSAGEQYRARITLQLAVAAREKAALVVIDGADILDKAGRNGLFGAIKAQGIMAVIGMTLLKPEEMPDLARAGIGESVWIEAGHAVRGVKEAP